MLNSGFAEELRANRPDLIQQRIAELEANPDYGTLIALPASPPITNGPTVDDGIPFSISIMEEHQRTREFLLRVQRDRILQRQEEFAEHYGDPAQPVQNQNADEYRARAEHHREFVELYRQRVESRQDIISRYETLLELHRLLTAPGQPIPTDRIQQWSRESVERHRERLEGHQHLLQDEQTLIQQYQEMVRHFENLVQVALLVENAEMETRRDAVSQEADQHSPAVEMANAEPLIVDHFHFALPDVRFRPGFVSTPLQGSGKFLFFFSIHIKCRAGFFKYLFYSS